MSRVVVFELIVLVDDEVQKCGSLGHIKKGFPYRRS